MNSMGRKDYATQAMHLVSGYAEARHGAACARESLPLKPERIGLDRRDKRRFLATCICLILFHRKDGKSTATPGNGCPVVRVLWAS